MALAQDNPIHQASRDIHAIPNESGLAWHHALSPRSTTQASSMSCPPKPPDSSGETGLDLRGQPTPIELGPDEDTVGGHWHGG